MKLYNANLSPYTGRVRIALYAKNPLDGRPKLARVNEATAKHPAVAKVLGEMGVAMAELMQGGGR